MIRVTCLIWDSINQKHIARHHVAVNEVEEVCLGKNRTRLSFRKRILIEGKTKTGRKLRIVLSPEDQYMKPYEKGKYYVITAFEKEEKHEAN